MSFLHTSKSALKVKVKKLKSLFLVQYHFWKKEPANPPNYGCWFFFPNWLRLNAAMICKSFFSDHQKVEMGQSRKFVFLESIVLSTSLIPAKNQMKQSGRSLYYMPKISNIQENPCHRYSTHYRIILNQWDRKRESIKCFWRAYLVT